MIKQLILRLLPETTDRDISRMLDAQRKLTGQDIAAAIRGRALPREPHDCPPLGCVDCARYDQMRADRSIALRIAGIREKSSW